MPLPNKTKAACLRYLPYVQALLLSPVEWIEVEYPKELSEATFVARLRDALSGIVEYNWFSYDKEQINKLNGASVLIVKDKPFVVIGTRKVVMAKRKEQGLPAGLEVKQPVVDTLNAIELSPQWVFIDSIAALINFAAFNPQPIFSFTLGGDFPSDWQQRLATEYPNVILVKESPPNENKYKLL